MLYVHQEATFNQNRSSVFYTRIKEEFIMHNTLLKTVVTFTLILAVGLGLFPHVGHAQEKSLPVYLQDRGTGVATSMFGTYIRPGELIIYPFFEYYLDNDMEYAPDEFGYADPEDYRGKYRAFEGLIFIGYGLTDWLALEFEAAVITAKLEKSADDASEMPESIEESGLGDVEGQIRARWMTETERRPEGFSYFEIVAPLQDAPLIGTEDWEFKFGSGMAKGFSWGTMTLRTAVEYSMEESKFEVGEYAVEYLKRFSPAWLVYTGVEGSEDEVELIAMLQWNITESIALRLNNAFGITSKATDWAPEVGVMFSFPMR
jgi:hypothetical protein